MSTCGARFNRISGELTLCCYERIAYFRDLAAELPSVHQAAAAAQ